MPSVRHPHEQGSVTAPALRRLERPTPGTLRQISRRSVRRSRAVRFWARVRFLGIIFLFSGVAVTSALLGMRLVTGHSSPVTEASPQLQPVEQGHAEPDDAQSDADTVGAASVDPSTPESSEAANQPDDGRSYNVKQPPQLAPSANLQSVLDSVISTASSKGFNTDALSISLINLRDNTYAAYQSQTPRYPASVSKFFWMVACYDQLHRGILSKDSSLDEDLKLMVRDSSNEAASRIVDRISGTESGSALGSEQLKSWVQKRNQVSTFFSSAGYQGINLGQKNFPIGSMEKPQGRDRQWRGIANSIRNVVTTEQAARLMYEIYTGRAVSVDNSEKMISLLTKDLRPEAWKKDPNNPIKGFLGEPLPPDTYFASKVGLTTKTRTEVALVETKDRKASYILVVFANDPAYAGDETIFPEISSAVFNRMLVYSP